MARDDTLDDGEADAGAFELRVAMQPLEHAEQLVRASHVEAGAVVLHPIGVFPVGRGAAPLDGGFGSPPGVFDGVGEEINPNLAQHGPVAACRWQIAHMEDDGPLRRGRAAHLLVNLSR